MSRSNFISGQVEDELYSDFLANMNPHPVSGNLLRVTNEHAVTRSIRNLINTNRGERFYQPNLGSDIRKILFEHVNDANSQLLSTYISETIDNYEKRAKLLKVTVVPKEDANKYIITIVYMLVNRSEPISVDIVLQRIR